MAKAVDNAATLANALRYMPAGPDKELAITALSELLYDALSWEVDFKEEEK